MRNLFAETIETMRSQQTQEWDLASQNYMNLKNVRIKELALGNSSVFIQYNPKRILSSAAKVDTKSISERKCFLCQENLPVQQKGSDFIGGYAVLVNPYPIFPKHLTIPSYQHEIQKIVGKMRNMLELAFNLDDYVIFYNGPKCGASAPDHFHFQAGNKGFLPLESSYDSFKKNVFIEGNSLRILTLEDYPCPTVVIESDSIKLANKYFEQIYSCLEIKEQEYEPMMNIVAWYSDKRFIICVFPRAKHRPSCYFEEGDKNILISPASVDLGAVFITPREEDFEKISASDVSKIIEEVCINKASLENMVNQLKPIQVNE